MPRYAADELTSFLSVQGFEFEAETEDGHGGAFYAPDGFAFTFPKPVDGFFDADIVDRILSDRWIAVGPIPLRRYPD